MSEEITFPFKILLKMIEIKDIMKGMGFDPETITVNEYDQVIFTFRPDESAIPDIVGSVIPAIIEKSKEQELDLKEIRIWMPKNEIKFLYKIYT